MGSMNKEDSFKLLDAFVEAGGNFIDTAVSLFGYKQSIRPHRPHHNDRSSNPLAEQLSERRVREMDRRVVDRTRHPRPNRAGHQVHHSISKLRAGKSRDGQLRRQPQEESATVGTRFVEETADGIH